MTIANLRNLNFATCVAVACLIIPVSRASIVAPYTPDANTIFLLHLDESATEGISTNAVPGAASFIAAANPSAASPRNPLSGLLGAAGASGVGFDFGLCADLTFSNSIGLFMDANGNGVADLDVSGAAPGADAISGSLFTGPNGEFTLEALVNFPSLTGGNREIVSMDNSGGARPFQFRVTSAGQLEFNNIAVAGVNPRVAIPTTGPDAFVPNQWFHVAMTYDGAGTIVFYWTRLDSARTSATVLLTTNFVSLVNITASAVLTVGNENRNTSGEGLTGRIDEVRISNIARSAIDMVFDPTAPPIPPSINPQPEDQFLGVGETLLIVSHTSGSVPLTYQWQYQGFVGGGFSDIPGQTAETLSVPVTFATAGLYRYIVSNAFGQATSAVARVTVGAIFTGLAPTGFDLDGTPLPDNAIDPHYTLWSSSDVNALGPNTVVPADTLDYNANDAGSKWISPGPNLGGPRGVYTYRTTFLLDPALTTGSTLTASVLTGGSLTVLLNGQPTGVTNLNPAFPGPHRIAFSFTLTTGFVAGMNTLDFVVDNSPTAPNSPPGNALRVMSIRGIGPALIRPLTLVRHPQTQTVRVGGRVLFDVVALGGPLHYQWFGDDREIPGATKRTLTYNPVTAFGQPATFRVVVTNDFSNQTSQTANFTVVPDNQPPIVTDITVTGFWGAPLRLPLSRLVQNAREPDGDNIGLSTYDLAGNDPISPGQITLEGATLVYTNAANFVTEDQFTVTLADTLGAPAVVTVTVRLSLDLQLRIARAAGGNLRLSWPAAATAQGFRLISGDTIDAIATPVAGNITTDATESALQISPSDPVRFYLLTYP